jgi:hypothetical protein
VPDRRPARWPWPTLVVAGFVLLVGAALLRPGGSVHADVVERTDQNVPMSSFGPGDAIEQPFIASADGLSSVSVSVGTFGAEQHCTLDSSVMDSSGHPVAVSVIPCASLVDGELVPIVVMDPIAGSAGNRFTLRVAVRDQDTTAAIALFGRPPTPGRPAATFESRQPNTLAVTVETEYGNDAVAASQLGLALDRIGDYGPPWHAPVVVVLLGLASIALLAAATMAPRSTGIVLIVAFAVTKGILWSVVIPPFKGADEPAHFAYAQFLAVDHRIPKRGDPVAGLPEISPELATALDVFRQPQDAPQQPPTDRPSFGPAADAELRRLADAGAASQDANGGSGAAGYTPAYYLAPAAIHAIAPGTIDARLGAMRLWSVALGAVGVWATVMMGRRLFPGRESAALLLGAAVALQPMISQQTAVLTNDAMIIALGAICTWIAVALTDPRRSPRWTIAAGLALGVGLLAKPLAIVFAPVLAIAWLVGRRRGARSTPWFREAAGAAAGVAVTYGPWWLFAAVFGYNPVAIPTQPGDHSFRIFIKLILQDFARGTNQLWVRQLWGELGWINRSLPSWLQHVVLVSLLVGAAIVLAWLVALAWDWRRARRGRGPWRTAEGASLAAGTAVCFLVVAGTLAMLYVLMYTWFRQAGDFNLIQGRYALMAMPAILALPVLGLQRLAPRLSPVTSLAVVASAMAVLNVVALAVLVESFYL